jgi:hypothetical protein
MFKFSFTPFGFKTQGCLSSLDKLILTSSISSPKDTVTGPLPDCILSQSSSLIAIFLPLTVI